MWNFNNVNITHLNRELSQLDWFSLCEDTNDIDETYSCWYSHFRSVIEKYILMKTVTIRPNDKPWMDSKVLYRLLRIHNVRPSPVSWESYRAQRSIVTSLIRFTKKSFYDWALIRNWVIQLSTARSGDQSLIAYVIEKILHPFHPLLKTKCQFSIPRKKRAFLMSILCCSFNFRLPMPFLQCPIKHNISYPVLLLQESRCLKCL